ncbi:hypothetical protein S7335_3117 [Synechococcus sp. PCC 7335]|uniref:hypothetical protein n=1 Tax=Synechococcus sp. (strain ATCC 29403 / PCC 7335) TaxID=91464 RepID=UPI00017ED909|nr:hypothetical protein [Synechococcus sp. PCC 7335]EDX85416.1 hypothetical protein S7335_3117 [Synechococcus sp. PCC 7335]
MDTDTSSVTTYLVDYAAEGDELTDLLKALIPSGLSELDLAHAPKSVPSRASIKAIRIPCKLRKSLSA